MRVTGSDLQEAPGPSLQLVPQFSQSTFTISPSDMTHFPTVVPSPRLPQALCPASWSTSLPGLGLGKQSFSSQCPLFPSHSHTVWEGGRASLSLLPSPDSGRGLGGLFRPQEGLPPGGAMPRTSPSCRAPPTLNCSVFSEFRASCQGSLWIPTSYLGCP